MIKITADKVKIWRNEKDGKVYFTYTISNKKQDGTYEYMSKICKFMKDKEPSSSCDIRINNAFQSFYQVGDSKNDYLMIMEYENLGGTEETISDEIVLTDDDLPF